MLNSVRGTISQNQKLIRALAFSAFVGTSASNILAKGLPPAPVAPVNDLAHLMQSSKITELNQKLGVFEREYHHQIVVYTIDSVQSYGYGSIEALANGIGEGYKIGYRGEDTGVVLLVSKSPRQYRIETAKTERYVTDAHSKRILAHSKEVCDVADATCRVDSIVNGIMGVVKKEFDTPAKVQNLRNETVSYDRSKAEKAESERLSTVGTVIAVILFTWGLTYGGSLSYSALERSRKRKKIKGEALRIDLRLKSEKTQYPKWFYAQHIEPLEKIVASVLLSADSEEFERRSTRSGTGLGMFERLSSALKSCEEDIAALQSVFSEALALAEATMEEFSKKLKELREKENRMAAEGYSFERLPKVPDYVGEKGDALAATTYARKEISRIDGQFDRLSDLEATSSQGRTFVSKLPQMAEMIATNSEYRKIVARGLRIFGADYPIGKIRLGSFDLVAESEKAMKLIPSLSSAVENKDIAAILDGKRKAESVFASITGTVAAIALAANQYEALAPKMSEFEKRMQAVTDSPQFANAYEEWSRLSGKRTFQGFSIPAALKEARRAFSDLRLAHTAKDLARSATLVSEIEGTLEKIAEFSDFPAVLSKLKERLRWEEEERARQEEEDRRRRKEDEERREAAAAAAEAARRDNDSTPPYTPGGGDGWNGGGATAD